uniref:Uncharacterized protein n=1 Tax=Avena sativa TaxID=4498 RepID=A0ACD5TQZ0_AVESA
MCRYSDPLVLMQVTVFSCGGFVLGVSFNHAIADGVGMCQFLQAVGEFSRGLPSPSVLPVRQEDSISLGVPPAIAKILQFLGTIRPSQMALLDITVKQSLINGIKYKYTSMNSGRTCTVFEAVAAVLWRCRTRAIMSMSKSKCNPEAVTALILPTNARKYAGAKEGYYGNCLLVELVTATTGMVANSDLVDIVKMIQDAKDRVLPDQADIDELLQVEPEEDWYNILVAQCWRNIGLEALDFGAGRPARVMKYYRGMTWLPECTACIPCSNDLHAYNVLSVCVKDHHSRAFLQELADAHLLFKPSPL